MRCASIGCIMGMSTLGACRCTGFTVGRVLGSAPHCSACVPYPKDSRGLLCYNGHFLCHGAGAIAHRANEAVLLPSYKVKRF